LSSEAVRHSLWCQVGGPRSGSHPPEVSVALVSASLPSGPPVGCACDCMGIAWYSSTRKSSHRPCHSVSGIGVRIAVLAISGRCAAGRGHGRIEGIGNPPLGASFLLRPHPTGYIHKQRPATVRAHARPCRNEFQYDTYLPDILSHPLPNPGGKRPDGSNPHSITLLYDYADNAKETTMIRRDAFAHGSHVGNSALGGGGFLLPDSLSGLTAEPTSPPPGHHPPSIPSGRSRPRHLPAANHLGGWQAGSPHEQEIRRTSSRSRTAKTTPRGRRLPPPLKQT